MEKTWRWFGKKDKITLAMLKQIGVEGLVTALHDVPNGEIWTEEAIRDLQQYIESYGMRWSVVESLPVCEAIKYAGPEREQLIENYKISLANLGKCGVKTICYNFMPVLDWARTDLAHPWPDGTTSLYFDKVRFAYFDVKILEREAAQKEWPEDVLAAVEELDKTMTAEDKHKLVENIIVKTQGFVNGNINEGDKEPVRKFKALLDQYKGITRDQLRENMRYFLAAIMPVCEEYDINMCVHPDDPPMKEVFGLPRIVTDVEDIRWCGNEAGDTRESEWNVLPFNENGGLIPGIDKGDMGSLEYLAGLQAPYKLRYFPAEVDVSIRHGWFYRNDDEQSVRNADNVFDMYERSVGGNSILLLNLPPTREGVLGERDVKSLEEVGRRIRETYGVNLCKHDLKKPVAVGDGLEMKLKGVQNVNNPKSRGNLYITVVVEVPKNLSAEQKELLEKFAASCGEANYAKRTKFKKFFNKKDKKDN